MADCVLAAMDHLRQLVQIHEHSALTWKPNDLDGLKNQMQGLEGAIKDAADAMEKFGKPGFFKALVKAASSSKSLKRCADRLEKSLVRICRTLQLHDFVLSHQRRFPVEEVATTQIDCQLDRSMGAANATDEDRAAAALASKGKAGAIEAGSVEGALVDTGY